MLKYLLFILIIDIGIVTLYILGIKKHCNMQFTEILYFIG